MTNLQETMAWQKNLRNVFGRIEGNLCKFRKRAKEIGHLSTFQRQAIIKLIEKVNWKIQKNWRPISLLNVNSKIILKALSEKLKEALPDLVSSQQTAYVKNS